MTEIHGGLPEAPAGTDARLAQVARHLFERLPAISEEIHREVERSSPAMVSEPALEELLDSTILTNIELFLDYAKGNIALEEIRLPAAATAYSRRLAQREISSVEMLRVYRIGQHRVATEALQNIADTETDLAVAYAAAARVHEITFAYVDHVSEQVVTEYERERERWVANRNTVRTAMVASILDGTASGITAAEPVLGYRLRQGHVGLVLWDSKPPASGDSLRLLERAMAGIAGPVAKQARQLFIPSDQSQAWGWIASGAEPVDIPTDRIEAALDRDPDLSTIRVAVGRAGLGLEGFRSTHLEAIRAFGVASADDTDARVTTFADTGTRIVSLLAGDVAAAKAMVTDALGGLAADDASAARLRETLAAFFEESFSYSAVAKRLHMHRNTVKYRVDKAVELRGRPLDVDAIELQLALLLARSLGPAVLTG